MTVTSVVLPSTAPNPTASLPLPEEISSTDLYSIIVTLGIGVGLAILASVSTYYVSKSPTSTWIFWLAVAVGGLGGLAHEIAQSGGKILFFERKLDGFYIGSLAGVILGAVAGLLAVRGLIANPAAVSTAVQPGPIPLIFEVFFAGLALKGIAEAAGGQPLQSVPAQSGPPPAPIFPGQPGSPPPPVIPI